jgi:2-(3-amino-3-carboxypropyl)histidine synthase
MLDLEKAIKEIKKVKAKKVLLQFPDGLKPQATKIASELEEKCKCKCFIWAGSCYGACDTPDPKGFDLLLQFGHNQYGF